MIKVEQKLGGPVEIWYRLSQAQETVVQWPEGHEETDVTRME